MIFFYFSQSQRERKQVIGKGVRRVLLDKLLIFFMIDIKLEEVGFNIQNFPKVKNLKKSQNLKKIQNFTKIQNF